MEESKKFLHILTLHFPFPNLDNYCQQFCVYLNRKLFIAHENKHIFLSLKINLCFLK